MMNFRIAGRKTFFLPIILSIFLTACGGGGDTGSTSNAAASAGSGSGTATTYSLSVLKSGSGTVASSPSGINCGSSCSASYTSGTSVTLTATPATGYSFSGWSGACTGTNASCTVSMTTARSVTASFSQNAPGTYSLSVSLSGAGAVASSPSGINCGSSCSASYASGTNVTLTATAAVGYTFSGWSGACTGVSSTCTVAMSVNRTVGATFAMTGAAAGAPVLAFTDLDSGPNTGGQNNQGVFVTIWGKNFGATRGSGVVTVGGGQVANYLLWLDNKIIVQLGAAATSGNLVVTSSTAESSNGLPFTVRAGAIYFVTSNGTGNGDFATPMSPSAAYTVMGPGKTFYFRAGTYTGGYGDGGPYGDRNYSLGQAKGGTTGNPLALVGYPNEVAQFVSPLTNDRENISLADNSGQPANYVTIANLTLVGGAACVSDGGWYLTPKSGGTNIRVIGNVMSARYGGSNTMTGVILIQNDHWRVLGNEMKDTGTGAPINNNHGIYNQAAASDTEIAWNYFHDLRMGHVIQVHTDPYYLYTNVRIHDNVLTQGVNGDSRGINVGNALAGSYGSIYNNILYNVGQDFSGVMVYSGDWKVYNNTFYNVYASGGIITVSNLPRQLGSAPSNWTPPTADIRNNIIYSDGQSRYVGAESGASMSQVTLSNNLYYNFGAAPSQDTAPITGNPLFVNAAAANFHLQSGSPATNTGSSSVSTVLTMDHDGVNRPQGGGFDIGAYEQ